jgi:phosphoribosyl-ATP pyrophosphohydrolase
MNDALARLEATIRDRRTADPKESYVARLLRDGRGKIARKLGEEAIETVVAALHESDAALVAEAADLMFHLLLVLAERDIEFTAVLAELHRRENQSGISEKAARADGLPRRDTP